jgi:hypothetical protein
MQKGVAVLVMVLLVSGCSFIKDNLRLDDPKFYADLGLAVAGAGTSYLIHEVGHSIHSRITDFEYGKMEPEDMHQQAGSLAQALTSGVFVLMDYMGMANIGHPYISGLVTWNCIHTAGYAIKGGTDYDYTQGDLWRPLFMAQSGAVMYYGYREGMWNWFVKEKEKKQDWSLQPNGLGLSFRKEF